MAEVTHSTSNEIAQLIAAWEASIPPLSPNREGERCRPPVRPIRVFGPIAFVPLTKGLEALIDAGDADLVRHDNWHVRQDRGNWYASRSHLRTAPRVTALHRVIAAPPPNLFVDHINGNGLDCRRDNLRVVTDRQNKFNRPKYSRNSTGFKGVSFVRSRNKYQASIRSGALVRYLGRFDTAEQAYAAYCEAARELHGEYANVG